MENVNIKVLIDSSKDNAIQGFRINGKEWRKKPDENFLEFYRWVLHNVKEMEGIDLSEISLKDAETIDLRRRYMSEEEKEILKNQMSENQADQLTPHELFLTSDEVASIYEFLNTEKFHNIDFDDAINVLANYYSRATEPSGISNLIEDDDERSFFTSFESSILERNKTKKKSSDIERELHAKINDGDMHQKYPVASALISRVITPILLSNDVICNEGYAKIEKSGCKYYKINKVVIPMANDKFVPKKETKKGTTREIIVTNDRSEVEKREYEKEIKEMNKKEEERAKKLIEENEKAQDEKIRQQMDEYNMQHAEMDNKKR